MKHTSGTTYSVTGNWTEIFPTLILRKFMHDFVKLLIVLLRFLIVTLLHTIPIVVNR